MRGRSRRAGCLVKRIGGLLAMVLASSGGASANLLVDGGFEDPSLGIGNSRLFLAGEGIGAGWVVDSEERGVLLLDEDFQKEDGYWPAPAAEGRQFLDLGGGEGASTVHQTVSLEGWHDYALTFQLADLKPPYGLTGGRIVVDVADPDGVSVLAGGPRTFACPEGAGFTSEILFFTSASVGDYRLALGSVRGFASNVDAFRLEPALSPEPSSAIGFAVALAALIGMSRRSRL